MSKNSTLTPLAQRLHQTLQQAQINQPAPTPVFVASLRRPRRTPVPLAAGPLGFIAVYPPEPEPEEVVAFTAALSLYLGQKVSPAQYQALRLLGRNTRDLATATGEKLSLQVSAAGDIRTAYAGFDLIGHPDHWIVQTPTPMKTGDLWQALFVARTAAEPQPQK